MDFYAQNMSFSLLLQFVILNPKNICITCSCNLERVRAMFTAIKMLFNYKSFHQKCGDFQCSFVRCEILAYSYCVLQLIVCALFTFKLYRSFQ